MMKEKRKELGEEDGSICGNTTKKNLNLELNKKTKNEENSNQRYNFDFRSSIFTNKNM